MRGDHSRQGMCMKLRKMESRWMSGKWHSRAEKAKANQSEVNPQHTSPERLRGWRATVRVAVCLAGLHRGRVESLHEKLDPS